MGLAARCPECGTLFRVVQDQLRVSEGWVRCGRCTAVFNALSTLLDLDAPTMAAVPPAPLEAELASDAGEAMADSPAVGTGPDTRAVAHDPTSASAAPVPTPGPEPAPARPSGLDDDGAKAERPASAPAPTPAPSFAFLPTDATLAGLFRAPSREPPDAAGAAPPDGEESSRGEPPRTFETPPGTMDTHATEASPDLPLPAEPPRPPADERPGATAADGPPSRHLDRAAREHVDGVSATAELAFPDDEPIVPSFVRSADRAERWRRPAARRLLLSAAVGLTLLLGAQFAHSYRDWVVARFPATRPAIATACTWLGCRIDAPRSIEAFVVENSGLIRLPGTRLYRLTVVLRNHAPFDLATPWVDLTLTDNQGRVTARRVLSAGELGSARVTTNANSEVALQATIAVGESVVVGYTIDIFYP